MFTIARDLLFFHAPYGVLEEAFDFFARRQLNPEIYFKQHEFDALSAGKADALKARLDKAGLRCTFHSPFLDLNPGSVDEKIRTVSLNTLVNAVRIASMLEAKTVVIHTGYNPIYYGGGHARAWLRQALLTFQELASYAASKNMFLALENSLEPQPDYIIELIAKINSKFFKACVDVGHLNAFGKGKVLELLKRYPPECIREMHLSDNRGDEDEHRALGSGGIDFHAIFKYLEEKDVSPYMTIEAHTKDDIPHSLDFLEKNKFLTHHYTHA